MPGSPPMRMREAGTTPPPSTRDTSAPAGPGSCMRHLAWNPPCTMVLSLRGAAETQKTQQVAQACTTSPIPIKGCHAYLLISSMRHLAQQPPCMLKGSLREAACRTSWRRQLVPAKGDEIGLSVEPNLSSGLIPMLEEQKLIQCMRLYCSCCQGRSQKQPGASGCHAHVHHSVGQRTAPLPSALPHAWSPSQLQNTVQLTAVATLHLLPSLRRAGAE